MSDHDDSILLYARQTALTEATRLVLGSGPVAPADIPVFFRDIANIADSLAAYYTSGEVKVPEVSTELLLPSFHLQQLRASALDEAFRRAPVLECWNAADDLPNAIEAAQRILAYTLYGQSATPERPSSGAPPHAQASSIAPQVQRFSSEQPEVDGSSKLDQSLSSPVVRVASATVAEPDADAESASGEGLS